MTCGPSEARSICESVLYPTAVSVRRVFVASAFYSLVLKLLKASFAVAEVKFCGCGSPVLQSLEVVACLTALACVFVFCVLVALRQLWRGGVQDVAAICHCATMRPDRKSTTFWNIRNCGNIYFRVASGLEETPKSYNTSVLMKSIFSSQ